MNKIQVTKRNGAKEDLNLDKLHKVVFWATEGISGVSASEVELRSQIQFYNNIKSSEIQEMLIKSAADLITEDTPNYQYVAGRLINFHLRKQVYDRFEPWTLLEVVKKNTERNLYDKELLAYYTEEEWNKLDNCIKHDRDMELTYVAMEQLRGKYLVQNRVTGEIYETPQVAYMLIAATLFANYSKETRLVWVRDYYEAISKHDISLPTPVMAGVRTPQRQFSSCVLIETDDSLDSINATASAIVKYVSQKAGIGIGAGSIRAINSPIRNGDTAHTGVIPFFKYFQSAVKSCCVDKNTWVEIDSKLIQIKDLKVGDRIKTYHNNEVSFRPVVDIWNTEVQTEDRYVLEFTNGTKIRCSRNHPIMILTDAGVEQRLPLDITEFDEVITDSGSCYLYSITKDVEDIEYIDIEVEDTHTFFTAASKDDQMILTHNSQGGVRGGAATLYYPIWHLEVEDLLVLKNNKGTEDTRVRHMDYGVQFNKLMYERLLTGGDITLFSPNDVPGLYDAFFNDQDRFRELYETAERNTRIRKKKVKAIDLFSSFISERKDTGRIYLQNVDHSNTHSSFDEKKWPVKQSNLCAEITLSTKPLNDINDEEGRIALCTLSAINWGNIKDPKDFEKPCTLAIRGLDALLSYQNYPVKAAELSTYDFRPLGVGIINLAYFLAKNDVSYTDPAALALVDKYAEAWSYYLIKASADLAAEQGACGLSEDTKYARGIVPCDTRKIEIDELVQHQERMPWNELREQLKETGIRNATVMALMPAECQSLNNELLLKSNQTIRLDDLIKTAGIDVDSIHEQQIVGQRFSFQKPIELLDSIAYECYYNGPQSVTEIEFEDGNVYRFTENHKLLVNRGEQEIWVSVSELNETDEIISINAK